MMSKMKLIGNKLLVCCCDKQESVYFCGSCFLRIPEQGIINHLSDLGHRKMQHVVVKVNKKTYNDVSKKNFLQALVTLDAHNLCPNAWRPALASSGKPGNASAAHDKHVTFMLDDCKVVKMDLDSKDYGAAKPMSVVTEPTSKTTRVVLEISKDQRNTPKTVPTSNTICQNPLRSILKRPAVASVCFTNAPSSTLTRKICTSSASVAKSAQLSRLPQRREFASTDRASDSTAGSTVVCKVTCRSASCSKMKKNPGYAKTVSKAAVASQMRVTSKATTPVAKSVKHLNTEAFINTARVKKSCRENADNAHVKVTKTLSAPHLSTIMSADSECRRPCKKPASTRTASGKASKIGLNQLIIVSWEGRKQVYCQLCSVRLKHSTHPSSLIHCYNYLKLMYPELNLPLPELESKLNVILANFVELEKGMGFQCPRKVEVQKKVYQKLAALPEDKALKMVKAMLRPQPPLISSSSADTIEALGLQAASPCEVSSSNDGVNKMSECSNDEPEQENKKLYQTLEAQMTVVKAEDNVVASLGQHHSSVGFNKIPPHSIPGSHEEEMMETADEDKFEPDSEAQSVQHMIENPDSEAVKAHSCTEQPLVTETQHRRTVSASQDLQQPLESPQKLSPVQTCSPQLPTPGSATPGPQSPSGPTHGAEQASKYGVEPGEQSATQTWLRTSVGVRAQGSSYLSFFLKASNGAKPVIGMALVWECRGMYQKTFYLCESCEEVLSYLDICHHMVSHDHHLKYLWKNHPQFLQMFWPKEDLPPEIKIDLFYEVVRELALRECFHKVDAQCVLLGEELHQFVRTAQFSEALKMMQNIRNDQKATVFSLPISPPPQSLDSSTPYQSLLAPTLNTDHQNDIEAGQNMDTDVENRPVAEDVLATDRASSPLYVTSSCSEPVVLPIPRVDTSLNSQETSRDLSLLSRFTPDSVQLQSSEPQIELVSKSTVSLTVRDGFPPVRKRPADAAPETLLRSCTSSPLEHPFPAKHTPNPVNDETESTSVSSSTESSALLVPKDEDMGSTSSENVKIRWDPTTVVGSQTVLHKRKWDSKCQSFKATVKNPPTNFVEEIETAASVDLGSVSSANISSEQFVKEKLPADIFRQ